MIFFKIMRVYNAYFVINKYAIVNFPFKIFQRRKGLALSFNKTYDEYSRGFGHISSESSEHWLGRYQKLVARFISRPFVASQSESCAPSYDFIFDI